MKQAKQYLGIVLGVFLIVLPTRLFFAPHNIAAGGIGGLAVILEKTLGFNMSITTLLCNGILLALGTYFLGKEFFTKTAIGTLLMPVFMAIIPQITVSDDILLSAIFGALLTAIGVDILYRVNASSGGTTIPPLIFKKYFGIPTAVGLFISDAIVVLISAYAFGAESFMYAIVVILLVSLVMEYISSGLSRKKVVYIISTMQIDIEQASMEITGRGSTHLKATGGYTGVEKEVLMIVCNDRDLSKIQEIVAQKDPKAFVIVQNASSVSGEGFTYRSVVQ